MDKRILKGAGWGAVATATMSAAHFAARLIGIFPVWKPVPAAVVRRIFGSGLPEPVIVLLAVAMHLAYGGFWAGMLCALTRRVTFWKGIELAVFLWLVMQLLIFPFLGWGVFGTRLPNSSVAIPAAAFAEHMVYGSMVGWLLSRSTTGTAP